MTDKHRFDPRYDEQEKGYYCRVCGVLKEEHGPFEPPTVMTERKGKYALVSPTPGGYEWWAINDMEKMYAVVTVQASFPNAEEVIRFAWAQIGVPR